MEIRRGLLAQMAQGGILDKILEVVDTFTPSESGIYEHEFSYDGICGAYFIVTDPPGNVENMLSESGLPGPGLLSLTLLYVYGSPQTAKSGITYTYRSDVSGYSDYWTPSITLTSNSITVNLAGATRLAYRVGYTYYLCRVKQ